MTTESTRPQLASLPASLRYLAVAGAIVQQIADTQGDNIEAAAQICANTIANDGLVFCWGGGHSRMSVEEMFPRIGSYPGFYPMVELALTFRVTDYLRVTLNHTELDSERDLTGERLPGQPERESYARVQVGPPDAWKLVGEWHRTDDLLVDEGGGAFLPDRDVWHASASLNLAALDDGALRSTSSVENSQPISGPVLALGERSHTNISQSIFGVRGGGRTRALRFDVSIRAIGREGELTSRSRESLLTLGRLLTYLGHVMGERGDDKALKARVKTAHRDVHSLADHIGYLSAKITFLLDATLGMINNEQNVIIKIFSVLAVALMPPTLVGTIYGMNFRHMPELGWLFGYPMALGLMVLSALVPWLYFKRKGWL